MIKINKKILILTCIIITILAAGLVSATAVNKTATTNPHKNTLNYQQDNSFSQLQHELSTKQNKYYNLTKDYKYQDTKDQQCKEGIKITSNNTVIDGHGHTINADKKARILNITGSNTTLKNIIFINGNTNTNGGSIYSMEGTPTLINCSFINNTASQSGGAIYIAKNTENALINSKFINNTAHNGGAIYFNGQVINTTIQGRFNNNTATRAGGAIYVKETAKNNTINSYFIENRAK